jgi:hypothetical protein
VHRAIAVPRYSADKNYLADKIYQPAKTINLQKQTRPA